jgi:cytochrome P450
MKLREEIDGAIAKGTISLPIKSREAQLLPYLQGVIYEGLRLTTPATLLVWKQAPPEGDTFNDQFIPGGTRVAVSVVGIMRDQDTFGEDADLFRPERWLDLDLKQKRHLQETTELNFGFGRFGCSGKPVAFMELNKVFVELFRNFDFQLINPKRAIEKSSNIQAFLEKGMWVKVTDRQVQ